MPTYPNTIVLKGDLAKRHDEAKSAVGAAIKPGHLVMRKTDGTMQRHNVAGGRCEIIFAKEDALQGNGITIVYADSMPVMLHLAQPGDVIYARFAAGLAAMTQSVSLTSAGDGTLKPSSGSDVIIAYSEEAIDNHLGAAEAFGRVRIPN